MSVKLPSEFGQVMIMGDPLIWVPNPLRGNQRVSFKLRRVRVWNQDGEV